MPGKPPTPRKRAATKPKPKEPATLAELPIDATEVEHLDALILGLARAFEDSPPGAKAQTAAQYRAAVERREQIRAVTAKVVTKADELANRRAARLAAPDSSASAGGGRSK